MTLVTHFGVMTAHQAHLANPYHYTEFYPYHVPYTCTSALDQTELKNNRLP